MSTAKSNTPMVRQPDKMLSGTTIEKLYNEDRETLFQWLNIPEVDSVYKKLNVIERYDLLVAALINQIKIRELFIISRLRREEIKEPSNRPIEDIITELFQ